MFRSRLLSFACGGLGLLALSACSGGGGSSDTQAQISAEQTKLMQESAAGAILISEMGSAVTDRLAEEGRVDTGVTRRLHSAGGNMPLALIAPFGSGGDETIAGITYDFDSSFSVQVDLDSTGTGSTDRYPHATGLFTLAGTVLAESSTGLAGTVSIALTATADTTISATNPDTGDVIQVPPGTVLSWQADLDWTAIDENNWSFDLDLVAGPNAYTVSVVPVSGPTASGSVSSEFSGSYVLARTGGIYSWGATVSGHHSTAWTNSAGHSATVVYTVVGPDRILVTINGTDYGPFTHWQLRQLHQVYLALRA